MEPGIVAARQHGVITTAQLRAAGLSATAIRGRVDAGWLRPVHRGVYAAGVLGDRGRDLAAVLACGEGAVLSHASAAALWGMIRRPHGAVDVTCAKSRRHRRGIRAHRARLDARDTTTVDGIPVTTPERTLVDLADVRSPATVRRALEFAERAGLVDRRTFRERPGRRRVVKAPHRFTRSKLEERFLALMRRNGLPLPETNQDVHGWEADFLWPEQRFVVELDPYATHFDRAAFERDRRKQNELEDRGYRVRRITDTTLLGAPQEVVALVRRGLRPR